MGHSQAVNSPPWYVEMVLRAQGGELDAFEALAVRYRSAVVAITFLRTGNRDDADDLAQVVLAKAQEKLHALNDPLAFPGWLKAIALSVCGTWYRQLKPTASLDALAAVQWRDYSAGPLDVLLDKERQKGWRKALLLLPGPNRYALLMHIWGGYSHQEIAEFLSVPVTTVEGRIHRAKNQLRRELQSGACELLSEPRRRWRKETG